jgi:hypothetical protein
VRVVQRRMPRQARLQFVSLKSSLVNLPVSLFGPLLERNIASLSLSPFRYTLTKLYATISVHNKSPSFSLLLHRLQS